MNEDEWTRSEEFVPKWLFVRDRLSSRKLRLFGVAYCRHLRQDRYFQDFARYEDWAERVADGQMTLAETVEQPWDQLPGNDRLFRRLLTENPARDVSYVVAMVSLPDRDEWCAAVLDCLVGNPFKPKRLAASCRTPTVLRLAEAIYQERGFARLPILADALEEAGCRHAEVLSHLRAGGEHVLGCWCLDLVLKKA